MKEYLEEMFIDDDRIFVLTKYTKNGNKKTSDHNVIMGKFRLKFNRNRAKPRTEFFNFKDRVNQDLFYEETNNSSKLSSSFSSGRSFPHNANIFMKNLKSTFHKCFDKVRISSGVKDQYGESQMQELPRLKMELRRFLLNNVCLIGKKIAEEKLKETEHLLSNNFALKSAEIIKEQLEGIQSEEGKFSQVGFWKIKQKFSPLPMDPPWPKRTKMDC
jgi:hypothetical protein